MAAQPTPLQFQATPKNEKTSIALHFVRTRRAHAASAHRRARLID